jgi:hypothetical protein
MNLVSSRQGAQFTPAGVLRIPLPAAGEGATQVLGQLRDTLSALEGGL